VSSGSVAAAAEYANPVEVHSLPRRDNTAPPNRFLTRLQYIFLFGQVILSNQIPSIGFLLFMAAHPLIQEVW
jgi:hypothetical protein